MMIFLIFDGQGEDGMITGLRVDTMHDDTRVMRAVKEKRNDDYQYLVELSPNKSSMYKSSDSQEKTILRPAGQDNPNLISFPFKLKRGLYDVTVSRVAEILDRDIKIVPETRAQYPEPVMVGEKYVVQVKIEDARCYDEEGVRVRIRSKEFELDSRTVYYVIHRENLESVKYYVPFNGSDRIDFFIKGVRKEEIDIYLGNPSFQIEKL